MQLLVVNDRVKDLGVTCDLVFDELERNLTSIFVGNQLSSQARSFSNVSSTAFGPAAAQLDKHRLNAVSTVS